MCPPPAPATGPCGPVCPPWVAFHCSPHPIPIPCYGPICVAPAPAPAPISMPIPVSQPPLRGPSPNPSTEKPTVHAGAKYLYPRRHVYIKIPSRGKKLWQHPGGEFAFKTYKVGTTATIKQLIEMLGGGESHAVTECYEAGSGKWNKGRTLTCKDSTPLDTLESLGWTEKRDETKPVWLCFHEA